MPTPLRSVIYIRVSTSQQAESGLSLEAQEARCRAYCTAMDLAVVEVVVDAGESARSLRRPGLTRALAMLDAGQADGIVIAKLDRLTRSVRDLGDLVERYFSSRCSLLSVGDSIDTRSAAGRLVLNVLASVSQWEREAIGERTREALAAKRARGEALKGAPKYGEHSVEEAATVAMVRELRTEGRTVRDVARMLGERGITSRTGKPYGKSQIARMAA